MRRLQNRGLTSYDLKRIGMILMVLDHIHYFLGFTGHILEWFSMAGRLSAPLFLFCLAEGFHYTHRHSLFRRPCPCVGFYILARGKEGACGYYTITAKNTFKGCTPSTFSCPGCSS